MPKKVLYLFVFLLFFLAGKGQGNVNEKEKLKVKENEVKATVMRLFDAMRDADGGVIGSLFTDSAILQTISLTPNEESIVKASTVQQFSVAVSKSKKGSLDERITFGGVHVDGMLASVWTPYQFYFDGNFSHCGANSFQLVYARGQWKIHYLIDTRRRAGCN